MSGTMSNVWLIPGDDKTPLARPGCTVGECAEVAVYAMPQIRLTASRSASVESLSEFMADPANWVYVLVCLLHGQGWWDGDDPLAAGYPLAAPNGYTLTPNPRMETRA